MPLPKIDLPTYTLKIPSNGKEVTIRPFLVKEEKLILMALESKDQNEIINTTKQIINNCIVEGDVNVDTLPFFDVDYLFIALRAKSVGESIEIKFTCNNIVDGNRCGAIFPATIDISNCEIVTNPDIFKDIRLSGTILVKMKYPSYSAMKVITTDEDDVTKKVKMIANSIDIIQDKDKVYTNKDFSKEELIAFVEGLTHDQFKKLETFVDNYPSFVITSEAKCSKCGFDHKLRYNEFTSFFI
jgi:hypothetical protein